MVTRWEVAAMASDGEIGHGEPQYAGSEVLTEDSVARVTYSSLQRGTITRYLEPGDLIDLPADRVSVEALEVADGDD